MFYSRTLGYNNKKKQKMQIIDLTYTAMSVRVQTDPKLSKGLGFVRAQTAVELGIGVH